MRSYFPGIVLGSMMVVGCWSTEIAQLESAPSLHGADAQTQPDAGTGNTADSGETDAGGKSDGDASAKAEASLSDGSADTSFEEAWDGDSGTDVTKDTSPDVAVDVGTDVVVDACSDVAADASILQGESCSNAYQFAMPINRDGSTANRKDEHASSCGGESADVVYAIDHSDGDLQITARGNKWASNISLREGCEIAEGVELACAGSYFSAGGTSGLFFHRLPSGRYQLLLDGARKGQSGGYHLDVEQSLSQAQFRCESKLIKISDEGAPVSVRLYDYVPTAMFESYRTVRNERTCKASNGMDIRGMGPEQVYEVNLSSKRSLRVNLTYDVLGYSGLLYLRPDGGTSANCADDTAPVDDICLPMNSAVEVKAGHYWLIVDAPSSGAGVPPKGARYHVDMSIL